MTKGRCKTCDKVGEHPLCQLEQLQASSSLNLMGQSAAAQMIYLQQLKDIMLAAYLLKGISLILRSHIETSESSRVLTRVLIQRAHKFEPR